MKQLIVALTLSLCADVAFGYNTLFRRGESDIYVFTVDFQYEQFLVDSLISPLHIYKISGEILELPNPYLQGGVKFGRFLIEPPIVDGVPVEKDSIGIFGGLRLKTVFVDGKLLKWGADATYTYHVTDSGIEASYAAWHEAQLTSSVGVSLASNLLIYGTFGANYMRGKYITQDKSAFTWRIQPHILLVAGFDFQTDPGGHVGVEAQLAENKIVSLYFQRRF